MIDFDIAKTWHKIFAEKLEFVAAGLIEQTPVLANVCDDTACKLGEWLYGPGKRLEKLPAYSRLMKSHERFHDIACHYLNTSLGKTSDQLKLDAEVDFKEASADVQAAIEQLSAAFENSQGQVVYASQYAAPTEPDQIVWDGSLAIGLPAIDDHHQALVGILSKLMRNPHASLHDESVVDNLTEITRILGLHFTVEEAHMRKLGVPEDEYSEHLRKHVEILDQCANLNLTSFNSRDMKVRDIAEQIRTWAIDHVIEYDFNIKNYLPCHQQNNSDAG